ncbi:MAG: TolC family protein [Candidatus Saccharimonadaceae bacterium]
MKAKLNKTMQTISLTMGLLLFSATIYAQEPISIDTHTTVNDITKGDSLIIDLETALSIAMNESPTIKVANMEIEKKIYTRKSTQSALYPQIDLVGQYTRAIKKQTMYLDGGFGASMGVDIDPSQFDAEELKVVKVLQKVLGGDAPAPEEDASPEGIQFGRSNMWSAGAVVNLPIIMPSLWKNIQLSSIDVEVAVEKSRSSKIELANQVKQAFYGVMLAQDSYNVYKKTFDTESAVLTDIQHKFDQGLVAEYDLITAGVRLQNIIPDMLQTKNAVQLAILQLKALMGIDLEVPLAITGSLSSYEKQMFAELLDMDLTLVNNSDLRQIDLQLEQMKKVYEIRTSQYLPTLTANFNYQYMSQNNDFKFKDYRWDPYSTAGITLAIPIFDGGRKHNEIKEAKISVNQVSLQREDAERQIKLMLQNQINQIAKSIEQVNALKSAKEQAEKGYEIALKRYETGMGTIVDVNQASLGLTTTGLQYNNAIYDYVSAKSELEKVIGADQPIL